LVELIYIRPHRHHDKVESFHLVEGSAEIIVLEDGGEIADIIELSSEKNFYYRLDFPMYHTLLVHSPVLVIHETTNGPFEVKSSDMASFSPPEGDWRVKNYLEALKAKSKVWKSARGNALAES
jgi:cupin fold WbuC family metalloprotein